MQTNLVDSEVLDPSPEPAVSWLEPLAPEYKKKRALMVLGTAVLIAALMVWGLFSTPVFVPQFLLVPLGVVGVGAWRYWAWMQKGSVRKFQSIKKHLTKWERFKTASPLLALGFGGMAVMLFVQWKTQQFEDWATVLGFLPFGLLGLVVYQFMRTRTELTPEAVKFKSYYDAQAVKPVPPPIWWTKVEDYVSSTFAQLIALKRVRYVLAGLLFWLAYSLSQRDDSHWLVILAVVALGLYFAKEILKWTLFTVAIGVAVYIGVHAVATIPVSAAIIIGALIIANSKK